jgi:hypothetical protein
MGGKKRTKQIEIDGRKWCHPVAVLVRQNNKNEQIS